MAGGNSYTTKGDSKAAYGQNTSNNNSEILIQIEEKFQYN